MTTFVSDQNLSTSALKKLKIFFLNSPIKQKHRQKLLIVLLFTMYEEIKVVGQQSTYIQDVRTENNKTILS